MSVLEGLLAGIVSGPTEETRWLVLADWLEEFDDPRRAELLRLHRRLLTTCCDSDRHPVRRRWQARIVALIAAGVRPCVPQETFMLPGNAAMTFSFVPPGSFLMGSDHPHARDEEAVHRVTLTKGLFVGIHPVTGAQWRAVTGNAPTWCQGPDHPVGSVSWDECQDFCRSLTEQLTGRVTVRLPTEAEWEYACRAGTTTEFHFGNSITTAQANFDGVADFEGKPEPRGGSAAGVYRGGTTEVGCFPPNSWGLFDMHGNVCEWCSDMYAPYPGGERIDPAHQTSAANAARVIRGGAYMNLPLICRSASRGRTTFARASNFGFRVCF